MKWQVVAFLFCIAFLLVGTTAPAQSDPRLEKLPPEKIRIELIRVKAEIERLNTSPDAPDGWKERQRLLAAYRETDMKNYRITGPLRERIGSLEERNDVSRWHETIKKLENDLYDLQKYDSRHTRLAGRRLFEARHAELAKQAGVETPQLKALGLHPLNYPQIDGSTSTQPLAVLITCHCFDAAYEWKGVEQIRSRVLTPTESRRFWRPEEPEADLLEFSLVAKADGTTSARLAVIINEVLAANASTNKAYLNLIEGRSELGLLARRPSPDELEAARMANVELRVEPCALDAFVFMVNIKNPIRSLSSKQVRDIYAGTLNRWEDAGGNDGNITAYQREENSGSQQLIKSLVMKETPLKVPNENLVGYLMISPYLQLSHDTSGIGYSVYYYERFMSGSPDTKTIAIDGIEANAETIASRKYPFVSEVFVVTRKNLTDDAPAAKLRNWLLSTEGQAVVRESGYVPLPKQD